MSAAGGNTQGITRDIMCCLDKGGLVRTPMSGQNQQAQGHQEQQIRSILQAMQSQRTLQGSRQQQVPAVDGSQQPHGIPVPNLPAMNLLPIALRAQLQDYVQLQSRRDAEALAIQSAQARQQQQEQLLQRLLNFLDSQEAGSPFLGIQHWRQAIHENSLLFRRRTELADAINRLAQARRQRASLPSHLALYTDAVARSQRELSLAARAAPFPVGGGGVPTVELGTQPGDTAAIPNRTVLSQSALFKATIQHTPASLESVPARTRDQSLSTPREPTGEPQRCTASLNQNGLGEVKVETAVSSRGLEDPQAVGTICDGEKQAASFEPVDANAPATRDNGHSPLPSPKSSRRSNQTSPSKPPARKRQPGFPWRLYQMLLNAEAQSKQHIVSFSTSGRSFYIHDEKRFLKEIIPLYWNQSHIRSFRRQLNNFGFERIASGEEAGAFFHKDFRRGRPDLARAMRRNDT